jgi:hypothetical protein
VYSVAAAVLGEPEIFVHAWLESGSAFYKAQSANPNIVMGKNTCARSDVDRIRNRTIEHEQKHYAEDKAFFDSVKVQERLERGYWVFDASLLQTDAAEYGRQKALAQEAIENAAYRRSWIARVERYVDDEHKVQIPNCTLQKP